MLFLQLKSGEYLTIGRDIAVQVFQETGNKIRVGIAAPKDFAILRGEVRERNGESRPEGVKGSPAAPAQDSSIVFNRSCRPDEIS